MMQKPLTGLFVLAGALAAQSLEFRRLPVDGAAMPEPRIDGAIAYDSAGRRIFLFGGDAGSSGPNNELWAYSIDGRTWTRMAAPDPPPARFGHTLVFDGARRRLVLFGGQAGGFFNDTWLFEIEGGRWRQVAGGGPTPSKRYGHSAVYDGARNRMILSHGFTDAGRFDDTWALDLETLAWRDISPPQRPLRRCLHHATLDAAGGRMLLYGGCASGTPVPDNCPLGDLWSFDLATHRWTELTTSPRPPARQWYGLGFDALRRRMVVFGGAGRAGTLADAWEFDPAAGRWSAATPGGEAALGRERHEGAFVDALGGVVFFGGRTTTGLTADLLLLGPPAGAATPVIAESGVRAAFSGLAAPAAPGKLMSIYGANLGPAAGLVAQPDSEGRLPRELAGTTVTVAGVAAPILYAAAAQLNIQIPYEAAGADSADVRVTSAAAGSSPPFRIALRASSPDLFPLLFHPDGRPVTAEDPASRGGVVVLFLTGHGATAPSSTTGLLLSPASPLRFSLPAATVTIGGAAAEILFQGAAPGTAGLMQINCRVSENTTSGTFSPVVLVLDSGTPVGTTAAVR